MVNLHITDGKKSDDDDMRTKKIKKIYLHISCKSIQTFFFLNFTSDCLTFTAQLIVVDDVSLPM